MHPKKGRNTRQPDTETRYSRLYTGVFGELPQLHSLLVKNSADIDQVRLMNRGYDWLAIIKASAADGTPIVCFGSGEGFIGALLGAESAVAANRWREDKPWAPPE